MMYLIESPPNSPLPPKTPLSLDPLTLAVSFPPYPSFLNPPLLFPPLPPQLPFPSTVS